MKSMLIVFATGALLTFPGLPSRAQTNEPTPQMRMVAPPFPQTKEPGAIAVTVRGRCEFARDGTHFHSIRQLQLLPPGSAIRTKKSGQLDLYLKRTGVALRLTKQTEIRLAKLEQSTSNGLSSPQTEVALIKGTIFTLERETVPGAFKITNPTGLAVATGETSGRAMVSARPSETKSLNLATPNLYLPDPSAKFDELASKDFGQNPRDLLSQLLEFDEIQSLAEIWGSADLGPAGLGKQEKPHSRRK